MADDLALLDPFELPPREEEPRTVPGRRRRHATRAMAKTAVLGIRMAPGERRAVNAAARRAGRAGASAWAREVILAAAADEEVSSLDGEAVAALDRLRRDLNSGVGSNLNQAMRFVNESRRGGGPADEDRLSTAVEEALSALRAVDGRLAALVAPRGRR